jgi:site-specific DNA-cytosine methylase
MIKSKLIVVDLFAGTGGFGLGFEMAGFSRL